MNAQEKPKGPHSRVARLERQMDEAAAAARDDGDAAGSGMSIFAASNEEEKRDTPSFTCPRCGATSFNPNDIRERYCGRCHAFVDDPRPAPFVCAACGAVQKNRMIVCEQCGKPLVFPSASGVASYRDDAFPERLCDYCSQLYRGPAVYCSLECATDDL